jgi:hypothetical protein
LAKYFRALKNDHLPPGSLLATISAREMTVGQTIDEVRKKFGVHEPSAARALYSLIEEKELTIRDDSPPATLWSYFRSPYSLWFWGVAAGMVTIMLAIYLFPSSSPFIYARYVFGSLMVLFIPGYSLVEALYPNKKDLDSLERLALSIGLSLALVPLVGLVLNYTPWGIRLDPIVFSLVGLSLVLGIAACVRKESYFSLVSKGGSK